MPPHWLIEFEERFVKNDQVTSFIGDLLHKERVELINTYAGAISGWRNRVKELETELKKYTYDPRIIK